MQFDLNRFLSVMLELYFECRQDGEDLTPKEMLANRPAVRMAVRRELWRQAKSQGANRRERRKFAAGNLDNAIANLEQEVDRLTH